MWRKGNPFALLVGMQTGAATTENGMELPQKIKNGTAFWLSNPTSGNIFKGIQNINSKGHKHPYVIAALFTITKIWKQLKCPSTDEWIKQLWDIHTVEYYLNLKKEEEEEKYTLFNSMNGPGEHNVKWNKPVRERQIPYDFTHLWNIMNKVNK